MIDLKKIRAVVLDIADAGSTYERQDEISDFIWCLLERNYKIFLVTSDAQDDLSQEDFNDPLLRILREEMPPSSQSLKDHPELEHPSTIWITDDPKLQHWIEGSEASLAHLGDHGKPGSLRLNRLSDLSILLDPTGVVLKDLTVMTGDLRRSHPGKLLVVGIGGPPLSGYQKFALGLKEHLQDAGFDLVELMDLSLLLRSTEQVLEEISASSHPWTHPEIGAWMEGKFLPLIHDEKEIYFETPPIGSPPDFSPHFPFYLSSESVLLIFGEMLFIQEIHQALDLSILLEVSPEETSRRLYEIPTRETIDPMFIDQYLTREGSVYREYLKRNQVEKRVAIRIDANHGEALNFIELDHPPLV